MKKILILFLLLGFVSPVFALEAFDNWVTDIKANNGHVTYTLNVYIPTDNDVIVAKNRRDYICSQNKEALLWGEAHYMYSGQTIDYTSLMDKSKLRKYVPIDQYSIETIQKIRPYCN